MASKLTRLTTSMRPIGVRILVRRSPFHITSIRTAVTPITPAGSTPAQTIATPNAPDRSQENDTKHAAYLGEADSNDGFETFKDTHGDPPPSLDATQAAYLGEADSDNAFEADIEINPEKHDHKLSDTSQAAFLGEADSDDAFEADVEINPEKHEHKIQDPSASGLHGQTGEQDS